jgi:uronate dehydrogenase
VLFIANKKALWLEAGRSAIYTTAEVCCLAAKKLSVLLTGSSGVIGKHLVGPFKRHYRLVTFDRFPAQNRKVDVVGDLCDFKVLKAAMKGIDVLVHLAATSDEASFTKELLPNNILGVYNTFQAAYEGGVRRIVFASSCQTVTMYPRGEQVQISQTVRPGSIYGVTKVFGEVLGRYYYDHFGIEFAGLRLGAFAQYGDPDLEHPSWLWRLWLSPRDAVSLFRCAVEKPEIGYSLVFGTSRTKPEFLSLKPAQERLGFMPQDDVRKVALANRR